MRKEASPEKVVQEIRRKTRQKASPRCAARRAWRRICITAGARSFSKPARSGSSATRPARRRRRKSAISARKIPT